MYSTKVEKKGFIGVKLGVKRQVVQPTRWCTQEWKKRRTKSQKTGFSQKEYYKYKQRDANYGLHTQAGRRRRGRKAESNESKLERQVPDSEEFQMLLQEIGRLYLQAEKSN